jgi:hypothetical protein
MASTSPCAPGREDSAVLQCLGSDAGAGVRMASGLQGSDSAPGLCKMLKSYTPWNLPQEVTRQGSFVSCGFSAHSVIGAGAQAV